MPAAVTAAVQATSGTGSSQSWTLTVAGSGLWGDNGTAGQRGELRPPHAEHPRACRSTACAGASGGCGAQALGSKAMPEGLAFSRW